MQGLQRRIVYISLYEGIAIVAASAGLTLMSDAGLGHSGLLAVGASVIAVIWNLTFNALFERWESRQAVRGRSLKRRIAHAIGFEGGLIAFLVPMLAWGLGVSLWQALVMDLGLVVFFLVYTFVFNWAFDRVFGLPASAMGEAQPA
ncbi:PACE efflux transporter [Variovorax sp. V118]|uniref:PACE efflux transporter n=1 Tax=Variovorax sp. V118 TaxID=3065954 RepID=UPI0034E88225